MTKLDRTIVLEPATTRSFVEWTPGLIKAARSMADAGNLSLAADFCESAMADDRVSAAISTRTNGLVALPLKFEAARGVKRLVNALEAGEDWWAAYPATALSQLLAWGIMLGVGLAQHIWTDRGQSINRLVPKLKVWNPRHLRWDWQQRRWLLRVDGNREIEITPGDGTWVLYMPYGDSRPWSRGAWRAIALWQTLKAYAIEDWARYSERHGQGTAVIQSPDNSDKEKRKELAAAMQKLGGDAALVLPPGFTYELVEAVADTWETFEAQKNAADLGNAVAILGQNLSTEVTGPVSTGATLHGRVLQTYIDTDAETLTTCVHDQSLVWWAEFNFGARESAPWPVYDTKPPEDRKANAEVSKTQAEAGKTLASIGCFTVNEVRITAGHEPLKPGEGGDAIMKPAPPPAPDSDGGSDETTDPKDGNDDPKKNGHASLARDGARPVHLRSGRTVPSRSGIVQGQLYVDDVVDATRARAASILDDDVVAVLEAIEAGESYDDVRARLTKTFKGMRPEKLAKLTEAAITMTELGGRHAMNEDT